MASAVISHLRRFARSSWGRTVLVLLVVLALGALLSQVNFRRDLRRVRAGVLSGPPQGHYHAIIENASRLAAHQGGHLSNVATQGSAENVGRLAAARRSCEVQFGLVQIGTAIPEGSGLVIVGRLPRFESLILLGRGADKITQFSQLSGLRIGIGPKGSGTAEVMRGLLADPDLAALGIKTIHGNVSDQLEAAADGELDLAALVIDEDAQIVRQAVRDRGLELVGFSHIDIIARRLPWLRHGRIGVGQFHAVKGLPSRDKEVLRIETMVLSNACAGRTETIGLLTVLGQAIPGFVQHNRTTPDLSGLDAAPAARDYFEKGGPDWADEYLPWLADLMPLSNWVYLAMALSVLLNVMGLAHRFRLWRVDVARVRLETRIMSVFGPTITFGDIEHLPPPAPERAAGVVAALDEVIAALEKLAARCRAESVSFLVPMGQEMSYRYQESLVHNALAVLRGHRNRCEESLREHTTS